MKMPEPKDCMPRSRYNGFEKFHESMKEDEMRYQPPPVVHEPEKQRSDLPAWAIGVVIGCVLGLVAAWWYFVYGGGA